MAEYFTARGMPVPAELRRGPLTDWRKWTAAAVVIAILYVGVRLLDIDISRANPEYGLKQVLRLLRFDFSILSPQNEFETFWDTAGGLMIVTIFLGLVATAEAIRTPVGYTPFTRIAPIYDRLAAEPGAVLAEFPFYWGNDFNLNGQYLLNNTRSFRPLMNGYSGFQSAQYQQRGNTLGSFPSVEALSLLKVMGVTHVTVHVSPFERRYGRNALTAVAQAPELELVAEDEGIRLYRVR